MLSIALKGGGIMKPRTYDANVTIRKVDSLYAIEIEPALADMIMQDLDVNDVTALVGRKLKIEFV